MYCWRLGLQTDLGAYRLPQLSGPRPCTNHAGRFGQRRILTRPMTVQGRRTKRGLSRNCGEWTAEGHLHLGAAGNVSTSSIRRSKPQASTNRRAVATVGLAWPASHGVMAERDVAARLESSVRVNPARFRVRRITEPSIVAITPRYPIAYRWRKPGPSPVVAGSPVHRGGQSLGGTRFAHSVSRSSSPNSSYSGRRPECASPSSRIFRTPSPRDSRNTCPVRLLRSLDRKLTRS